MSKVRISQKEVGIESKSRALGSIIICVQMIHFPILQGLFAKRFPRQKTPSVSQIPTFSLRILRIKGIKSNVKAQK